jgi:hypothetical protein
MSRSERETMYRLIVQSTEDGTLNLDDLRRRTDAEAERRASNDSSAGRGIPFSDIKDHYRDRLTIATREVLGLIPRNQWEGGAGWNEQDYSATFNVNRGDMDNSEARNPSIGMASQGVEVSIRR